MNVTRTRLPNGLTLIAQPMHAAPVVAVQAWVNVGSADEHEGVFGIAHVHEHMLFKGTARRGAGEIARTVEAAGGEINAWTSYDQTVYHVVLAASELGTGIDILADALRCSSFDAEELGRELEVIVEEIRRSDDAPARRIAKAAFALAYERHPYRRPVIGSEASVRGLTRERILDFFASHYRPDNVTLVVCGDFELPALRQLVQQHFGDWLPKIGGPAAPRPTEDQPNAPRVRILREDVKEARVSLCWHIPGLRHTDIAALDVLSVVLGHGDSSRLQEETRRKRQLVNDVYAYAYTPRDPGLFMLGAGFPAHKSLQALESILGQLYLLGRERVSERELEKAKVVITSEAAYQRETVQGEARKLGFFEVVAGDYAFEEVYTRALNELTPEDVRRVALRYFHGAPSVVLQEPASALSEERAVLETVARAWKQAGPRSSSFPAAGELGVTRHVLDNGTVLLVRPEEAPVVAFRAVALGGLLWESREQNGITNLLASVWGSATERMSASELSAQVASLGGHVGAFSGRNSLGLKGEFIRQHSAEGLGIFLEALLEPKLHDADVARERAVILERIKNKDDNPAAVAYDEFAEALYGAHPYGWQLSGTPESVAGLDTAALVALRARYAAPGKLVVSAVGGLDRDEVLDVLASALGGAATPPLPQPPALEPEPRARRVHRPLDKKQTHVIVGARGTTIDNVDRFALEVLTTVLSGQSGRLFMDLRDNQSLAYSVGASAVEGLLPGHILVHVGTSPEKVQVALRGVYEHLARIRNDRISEEELARALRYLVGTHAIDLQRCGARATVMALSERYGLGYTSHARYEERIRAVTRDHVREVAQRYLSAERLIEVTVGPGEQVEP